MAPLVAIGWIQLTECVAEVSADAAECGGVQKSQFDLTDRSKLCNSRRLGSWEQWE